MIVQLLETGQLLGSIVKLVNSGCDDLARSHQPDSVTRPLNALLKS